MQNTPTAQPVRPQTSFSPTQLALRLDKVLDQLVAIDAQMTALRAALS
jgi:hypothetical protein